MENPTRDSEGSTTTTLCRGNCGFYGSPAQEGYCSKCFKDALKKKQDPNGAMPMPAAVGLTSPPSTSSLGSTASTASQPITIPSHSSSASLSATSTSETQDASLTPSSCTPSSSFHDSASCPVLVGPDATPPKKKTRCVECKKKVGLTGFECRCGGLYCGIHRYSDMHKCTFDYKALGEEQIRKANPVVAAQKIQKI